MAIEHVHAITDGNITVKWEDSGISNEIHASVGVSDLLVQDLINAIRAAEASVRGQAYGQIARASGKETLGTGVGVGITLELLGTWRVYSTKTTGVFTVLGGNLVKSDGTNPFRPNNQITYYNILSAASTLVTTSGSGGSGGGLTSGQATQLAEIHAGSAPLVGAIFAFLFEGTGFSFGAFCRKALAIFRGNATFTDLGNGTSRIEYRNQAGTVEETHEINQTSRTVT